VEGQPHIWGLKEEDRNVPHLHYMVQVTQFRFFPPMCHRLDITLERLSMNKSTWIPIFSERFQASFTCGNKSDMNQIRAFVFAM